jgi:hypothetical protein
MPLLATLPDAEPDEILGLQPAEEDYLEVFAAEVAQPLAEAYDQLWKRPPRVSPGPARRDLRVHACPASLFGADNPFARRFPTGYQSIAPALNPDRVWLAWRYSAPGRDTGLAFDGLVFVRGNWVWFPKPFDVISRAPRVRT